MSVGGPQIIVPLTSAVIALTTTPLLAARDLSPYDLLLFAFLNDDAANTFDATIETGEDSNSIDGEFAPTLTVSAAVAGVAGQRSIVIGPGQIRSFYRVSAIASGAPVNARWMLKGIRRAVLGRGGVR